MGLYERAVAAVKQYKFKPATLGGRPVPVQVNVEVDFRIY
jgi:outer membrane biosynthesis protein TonB